jgi:hypothetical protein
MEAKVACRRSSRLDALGGALSIVCAIHCLVVPIALPFLATIVGNIWFEGGMMIGAIVLGSLALSHGFKWHGFRWPMWSFGFGIASLIVGNWVLTGGEPLCCGIKDGHAHDAPLASYFLVAVGGAMILSSHVMNFIFERRAKRLS